MRKQLRESYTIDFINFSLLNTQMNTTTYSYLKNLTRAHHEYCSSWFGKT